jgi:hypothetical protein
MRSCHLFVMHVLCILLLLYNRPNNIGWVIRKFVLIIPLSAISSCTCFLAGEEAYCGKLLSVRTEILFRIKRQTFLWFSMEYLNKVRYFGKSHFFPMNHEQTSVITTLTVRYIRKHASFKITKEKRLQIKKHERMMRKICSELYLGS